MKSCCFCNNTRLRGSTEVISNEGTAVGWLVGGTGVGLAFVRPLGGPMESLPKLNGMIYASAYAISPNGQYIVGQNSTDLVWQAVRWDRSSGSWQPRALYAGGASAVSNNGAVVGTMDGQARIWTGNGLVTLPGTDTVAHDINASGTVIVGFRWQPCPEPCGEYEVPMAWVLKNGVWIAQDMQRLVDTRGALSAARFEPVAGNDWIDPVSGAFVRGREVERIRDLDEIPSPYLTGLMDPFLGTGYFPMLQIARGCPFTCQFCNSSVNADAPIPEGDCHGHPGGQEHP